MTKAPETDFGTPAPVAWALYEDGALYDVCGDPDNAAAWPRYGARRHIVPLYAAPPQAPEVARVVEAAVAWDRVENGNQHGGAGNVLERHDARVELSEAVRALARPDAGEGAP